MFRKKAPITQESAQKLLDELTRVAGLIDTLQTRLDAVEGQIKAGNTGKIMRTVEVQKKRSYGATLSVETIVEEVLKNLDMKEIERLIQNTARVN